MGRKKSSIDSALTMAPKVGSQHKKQSRKLELLKIYGSGTDDEMSDGCLTSRSDGYPSVRIARSSPPDLARLLKPTIAKLESNDENIVALAPLKKVPALAKKPLTSLRHQITKSMDDASTFTNFSLRFAEEKGAKILDDITITKSAVLHEERQKKLVS
jgi:hypothetical protein